MSEILTSQPTSVRKPTAPFERVSGLHVLIADADGSTREARERQLLAAGHRVSLARTGFEALVKATFHLPDFILLDASLPGLGTAETMGFLSTCPTTAHIPVQRLSAGRSLPQRILAELRRRAR